MCFLRLRQQTGRHGSVASAAVALKADASRPWVVSVRRPSHDPVRVQLRGGKPGTQTPAAAAKLAAEPQAVVLSANLAATGKLGALRVDFAGLTEEVAMKAPTVLTPQPSTLDWRSRLAHERKLDRFGKHIDSKSEEELANRENSKSCRRRSHKSNRPSMNLTLKQATATVLENPTAHPRLSSSLRGQAHQLRQQRRLHGVAAVVGRVHTRHSFWRWLAGHATRWQWLFLPSWPTGGSGSTQQSQCSSRPDIVCGWGAAGSVEVHQRVDCNRGGCAAGAALHSARRPVGSSGGIDSASRHWSQPQICSLDHYLLVSSRLRRVLEFPEGFLALHALPHRPGRLKTMVSVAAPADPTPWNATIQAFYSLRSRGSCIAMSLQRSREVGRCCRAGRGRHASLRRV